MSIKFNTRLVILAASLAPFPLAAQEQPNLPQQIADVTPQWRVVDVRRGTEFNIREIHQDRTTALYEMMIESGVAT